MAEADLRAIFRNGVNDFGIAQAESYHLAMAQTFAFLSDYPRAARERLEITPPVRAHPYRSHLIIYELDGADILILRVRHAREDWVADI